MAAILLAIRLSHACRRHVRRLLRHRHADDCAHAHLPAVASKKGRRSAHRRRDCSVHCGSLRPARHADNVHAAALHGVHSDDGTRRVRRAAVDGSQPRARVHSQAVGQPADAAGRQLHALRATYVEPVLATNTVNCHIKCQQTGADCGTKSGSSQRGSYGRRAAALPGCQGRNVAKAREQRGGTCRPQQQHWRLWLGAAVAILRWH